MTASVDAAAYTNDQQNATVTTLYTLSGDERALLSLALIMEG
jgi:hypothetical protein